MREIVKRNNELWSKVDGIQKTMKKFFKFQIEEEDMKEQINQARLIIIIMILFITAITIY